MSGRSRRGGRRSAARPASPGLTLQRLATHNLAEFERLLGGRDFDGCFCAVWTQRGDDWVTRCRDPSRPNLTETIRRVEAREHVGFLVYEGGEPVAWTGSGPKTCFPRLRERLASRLSPATAETWSVGCIAIPQARRGHGLSRRIILAVAEAARGAGALVLEAYPTELPDPERAYRGLRSTLEQLGFQRRGVERDDDNNILLMCLELGATGSRFPEEAAR